MNIGQLTRASVALAAVTVMSASLAAANDAVRAVNAIARGVLDEALATSPTVRRLAADLARTDVIVYVGMTLAVNTPKGGTQLAVSTREARYLRVTISTMLNPIERAAMLAHELWHALEIAHTPGIRTQEALRAFYRGLGGSTENPDLFETDGAREAERRARNEIYEGAPRPQPEATRARNFPVTNGVTNGREAQHPRGRGPALR